MKDWAGEGRCYLSFRPVLCIRSGGAVTTVFSYGTDDVGDDANVTH